MFGKTRVLVNYARTGLKESFMKNFFNFIYFYLELPCFVRDGMPVGRRKHLRARRHARWTPALSLHPRPLVHVYLAAHRPLFAHWQFFLGVLAGENSEK